MSLAGGRGIPEALPTSARIGTGWAFELLQDTLEHARYVGTSPWAALADLGERTGMSELTDLGGALLLVADDGAKVRASLTARASTQRRRQLAEAEGEADKADQSSEMAQVVLAVGFVLFLGYPAVVNVLAL
jgi:tight adherence protein C